MLIKLQAPRNTAEENYLKQYVFDDIDAMVQAVKARGEKMTMEMFATGKITDKSHGISIDYGVPKAHQTSLTGNSTWGKDGASIIENLQDWSDKLDITPTRALTSKKVLRVLMRSTEIKEAIFGKDTGRVVGQSDLDQWMTAQGLPIIRAYDGKYRTEDAKGNLTTESYFPEDRIVLFNDEVPGQKIYGPTPEENRLVSSNAQVSNVGNVMAKVYETSEDPIGTWILAAATMLPSFASANNVFQAKVL